MNSRSWERFFGALLSLFLCIGVSGEEATGAASHSPTKEEILAEEGVIVKELYAYAGQLFSMKRAERLAAYKELAQDVTECQKPRSQLKLALLTSGIEPELTDLSLARKLLEACMKWARGPILSGYINDQLRGLSRYESQYADIETLQEKLAKAQHENEVLRKKVETLESQLKALTKVEQGLQDREQNRE